MFGYKFIKKETIENYEKEILSLKGKLITSQEALNAENENLNELLNRFAEATREINELRDKLTDIRQNTPVESEQVERKPRKRTTKKKVEEKVEVKEEVKEEPKKTQKKKRTYKKKNEKKNQNKKIGENKFFPIFCYIYIRKRKRSKFAI